MSETYVPAAVRRQVRARAGDRCEYCLLAEDDAFFPREPDHILALKHGGVGPWITWRGLALTVIDVRARTLRHVMWCVANWCLSFTHGCTDGTSIFSSKAAGSSP